MTSNTTPSTNKPGGYKNSDFQAFLEYLERVPATATEAAVTLGIYRPTVCRYKRALEKAGTLAEIRPVVCTITKRRAALLTADPTLFPKASLQVSLF